MLGPLYGGGRGRAVGWRGIFWINIPLARAGGRGRASSGRPRPARSGRPAPRSTWSAGCCSRWRSRPWSSACTTPTRSGACCRPGARRSWPARPWSSSAFGLWECAGPDRLLDLAGAAPVAVPRRARGSLCAGAALMVTLVDVQLVAQTLLRPRRLRRHAAAVPVPDRAAGRRPSSAASSPRRFGERWVTVGGMLVAARRLPADRRLAGRRRPTGAARPIDLVVAGLGLGLVIAPLSAAVLRATARRPARRRRRPGWSWPG